MAETKTTEEKKKVEEQIDKEVAKDVKELEKETQGKTAEETEEKIEEKEKELAKEIAKDVEKQVQKEHTSKPAVAKETGKTKKEEGKTLEREYTIPIRKEILKVPAYKRAKKAIKAIKQFLARHMQIRDRDLNKIKIDIHLNNEVWFKGIKKPLTKIKVKATKKNGIVHAELAELPKITEYRIKREEKRAIQATKTKETKKKETHTHEAEKPEADGVDTKTEQKEDKAAKTETEAKIQKEAAKTEKHTSKGQHAKKTMPITKKPGK